MTVKSSIPFACLLVASLLGPPSLALAGPPDAESEPASDEVTGRKIALIVDASEIDEEFRQQLEIITARQLKPELEGAGFEVSEGVVELALRVRFTPIEGGQFRDHGIYFELVRGGEVESAIPWVLCNSCGQARLEGLLAENAAALLEAVESAAVAGSDDPQGETDEGGEGGHEENPHTDSGELPKPIGPLGISGGVIAAVGIGLSIGGAIVLADPVQTEFDPSQQFDTSLDRTGLGIGLIVPGATLFVAGAVMLAVDVSKRARQRKRADALTIVPTFSPTSAGIGVAGQF